jgi:hypothetical protein
MMNKMGLKVNAEEA